VACPWVPHRREISMRYFLCLAPLILMIGCSSQKQHPDFTRSDKTTIADAYYVRAYRNGAYVVNHKGHRLTAKCRESLSWVDGNDQPYKLMDDRDCTYMGDQVGKYIGDDLMLRYGNELHLCPWIGVKTTQTADILDVTGDELIKGN
jgi:hypothetical protein